MAADDDSSPIAPEGVYMDRNVPEMNDDNSPCWKRESSPNPLQPEVGRGEQLHRREFLEEEKQIVVRAVSDMDSSDASFIRAAPAWAILRSFGQVLRGSKLDPEELYSLSSQVDSIDEFWSHSWQSIWFFKVWLLLMLKNGRAACVGGTLVALVAGYLSYTDLLPGWYKEPRVQGPGYSGEFRFSPWSNLTGCASALLLLVFWQSSSKVFLDRACIHQGDPRLKAEGILNLGAILKKSRSLVVVWDPSYLSRLWCVFELAAFLRAHREDPQTSLVIKPTVLVPMTFLMAGTTALTLLFETCLPDTDEVAFLRIFLFVFSSLPNIWLFQRLWRTVMEAEKQFGTFSFQKVTCYCCSTNHKDSRGNQIPCDKEILEGCIVEWYGSVNELELSVRTKVRDSFIEQVTRFPMGYQWLVGVQTCILWGQLDPVAARAHGGAYSFAASKLITTIAWFLWVVPVHYLFVFRVSHWMTIHQSKPLLLRILTTCVGYAAVIMSAAFFHILQAALYQAIPEEPLIAGGVFVVVTLGLAAVGHRLLTRPWKKGQGPVGKP
eukprot:s2570_g8.t1